MLLLCRISDLHVVLIRLRELWRPVIREGDKDDDEDEDEDKREWSEDSKWMRENTTGGVNAICGAAC